MSVKVTYLGEEDGPEDITVHGQKFTVGKAVDAPDDVAVRLIGNPFFKRDDGALNKAVSSAVTEKAVADKAGVPAAAVVDVAKK